MRKSARFTTRWGTTPTKLIRQPQKRRPAEAMDFPAAAGRLEALHGNPAEAEAFPSTSAALISPTTRPAVAVNPPAEPQARVGAASETSSPACSTREDKRTGVRRKGLTWSTRSRWISGPRSAAAWQKSRLRGRRPAPVVKENPAAAAAPVRSVKAQDKLPKWADG